jgi:Zn-dependent protease with chaperone function
MPHPARLTLLKKIFLFLCTAAFVIAGQAQSVFMPASENTVFLEQEIGRYEKIYKERLATLPSTNKKDYQDIYTLRWKFIREKFDEKEIYTDPAAQQYLDALVSEIVKANPVLKSKSFSCFFSRSATPNASYLGESIIVFNMGLFKRLSNESQAAFVICHELAHFYLQHSDKSIQKYVTTINSSEVQRELRKIKQTEYRKREQFDKLATGFAFNTRRHGRDNETEADSLAVELMKATRFDATQAVSTLELLDKIDIDSLDMKAALQKVFHSQDYPFQKRWIAVESGLLGGHAIIKTDQSISDSLKTHPDCKTRMKVLQNLLLHSPQSRSGTATVNETFFELQKRFSYEIVEYAFTSGNYTRSLFLALEMLEKHPTDPYLITQIGKLFNALFEAQKNHTLGKFIELPSPFQPPNYNILLQFIQNLYREEYASISYHFLKQFSPQLDHYQPFKKTYSSSIQIAQR